MLKHFFLFIVSERIPYNFLFEEASKAASTQYENSFHRLVPCKFSFLGQDKTIYISVPQSKEYDQSKEQSHMIETIKSHFSEVNEYVLRHNEKIYLTDENGKVIGIDEVFKHYSSEVSDVLIDPFKTQTRHITVFRAIIKTMQCDLASPISRFLRQLIEKIVADEQTKHMIRMQAGLETILSLLASQLY